MHSKPIPSGRRTPPQCKAVLRIMLGLAATSGALASGGRAQSDWSSSAHLGYGVARQASNGFAGVSGSMVFLDLEHHIDSRLTWGLRTLGQGGRAPQGEYYRMGAGPLLTWAIAPRWHLQMATGFFRETGLNSSGDLAYASQGHSFMIGWERFIQLTPRAQVGWGGFLIQHGGTITPAAGHPPTSPGHAAKNSGITQGIELALKVQL